MEGQLSNWTPIIGSLAPSSPSYIIKFNWLIQLLFLWGHLPAFWTPLWLWIQANQLLVIFLSNGNVLDWPYLQNGPVLNFSLSNHGRVYSLLLIVNSKDLHLSGNIMWWTWTGHDFLNPLAPWNDTWHHLICRWMSYIWKTAGWANTFFLPFSISGNWKSRCLLF